LVALFTALAGTACSSGDKKNDSGSGTTVDGSGESTTTGVTLPIEQLQSRADSITNNLVAHKWQAVVDTFSPSLKASFTVDSLKLAWGQVEATYGAYKSRGATTRTHVGDPQYVIFDTPMSFGSSSVKSRISFDANGDVGDLKILQASVA